MASKLISMPDEILTLILQAIHSSNSDGILALCLVNKQICRLALPFLHRNTVLRPEKLRQLARTEPGHKLRENVVAFTRDISIKEVGFDWVLLERLLADMKQLSTIHWSSWEEPIPKSVLDCLSVKHQNASLHIQGLELGDTEPMINPRHDLALLDGLFACRNVKSVDININYEDRASTRQVKEFLMSCTNLEVLRIRAPILADQMRWTDGGYIEHGAYDLCVEPGEQLSHVRELVYESFRRPRMGGPRIPISFWDWTQVIHLEIRGEDMFEYLEELTGVPTSLKTLKVGSVGNLRREISRSTLALVDFMSGIHGLTDLELTSPTEQLPVSIFTQQGLALKRLCYHPPRTRCNGYPAPARYVTWPDPLPQEHLDEIASSCPNIESLAINMFITHDLDYAFLAAVARFPSLNSLRLYVDIRHDQELPPIWHIESEMLVFRCLANFLLRKKVGCAFDKIELVLRDRPPYIRNRFDDGGPPIKFTALPYKNGDLILEYECPERTDPGWADYFDVSESSKRRGHTFMDGLLNWNKIGDEADEILAAGEAGAKDDNNASPFGHFSEVKDETAHDDMASLFGDSSDAEEESSVDK